MTAERCMKQIVAAIVCTFLLVGCHPPQRQDTTKPDSLAAAKPVPPAKMRIMLLTKSQTNPYYVMMERGARRAADELGVTLIARGTPNETHVAMQKNQIIGSVAEGIDALVFVPSNPTQLIYSLKQVQQQGMVLVNLDDRIDPEKAEKVGLRQPPFIGIDNYDAAYLLAQQVLQQHPEIKTTYIFAGAQTSKVAAQRTQGFRQAMAEAGTRIVGQTVADWQFVLAHQQVDEILAEHHDIDAIFCGNDAMALGVVQRLAELQRTEIQVVGYDAIPEARNMVAAGKLLATLEQRSGEQGYLGVKAAVALLQGESVVEQLWVEPQLIMQDK